LSPRAYSDIDKAFLTLYKYDTVASWEHQVAHARSRGQALAGVRSTELEEEGEARQCALALLELADVHGQHIEAGLARHRLCAWTPGLLRAAREQAGPAGARLRHIPQAHGEHHPVSPAEEGVALRQGVPAEAPGARPPLCRVRFQWRWRDGKVNPAVKGLIRGDSLQAEEGVQGRPDGREQARGLRQPPYL